MSEVNGVVLFFFNNFLAFFGFCVFGLFFLKAMSEFDSITFRVAVLVVRVVI